VIKAAEFSQISFARFLQLVPQSQEHSNQLDALANAVFTSELKDGWRTIEAYRDRDVVLVFEPKIVPFYPPPNKLLCACSLRWHSDGQRAELSSALFFCLPDDFEHAEFVVTQLWSDYAQKLSNVFWGVSTTPSETQGSSSLPGSVALPSPEFPTAPEPVSTWASNEVGG
jgi:hypothetical protein